ncbi:replication factor A protein [Trifolium repens]|nr:replication factor A protein [Trifolium repens]
MVYNEKEKVDSTVDDVAEILPGKENLKFCNGLTFTNIAEICAHTHDYEYLVDVIGVMTGISTEREYIRDGKVTKIVIIELTDHSVNVLCLGTMLNVPIVVIQFAKVKIFREKVSIQSVLNTTRILVNPYITEVEAFKDSIAVHGIEDVLTFPLIGEPAKPSFDEVHVSAVHDLIVTPRMTCGKDEVGSDVSPTVKRNLTKVFDKVVRGQMSVALKKVKIEKE